MLNALPFRILITSAGTATALGVIKGLAFDERFELHTTDINPFAKLAIGAFPIKSHTQVPLASDEENYLAALAEIIASKNIDYIYPVHDAEIRAVTRARSNGLIVGGTQTSADAIFACTDKLRMSEIAAAHGVPSPRTCSGVSLTERSTFPIFVKPRSGVGSVGARRVDRFDQMFGEALERFVVQEICAPPEITVDVLTTLSGTVAVARERIEVKAGVCVKARVWRCYALWQLAEQIATAFRLTGLFCFQVMRRDTEWVVTDINPRSGGASAMTLAVGINLYKEHFLIEFWRPQ